MTVNINLVRAPANSSTGEITDQAQTIAGPKIFTSVITPTAGIAGNTTGAAVSANNVGERISSSAISQIGTTSANVYADVTGAILPLTPGNWMIYVSVPLRVSNNTGATRVSNGALMLTDSANTLIPGGAGVLSMTVLTNNAAVTTSSFVVPVSISTSTTYKLRIINDSASTTSQTIVNAGTQSFAGDGVPLFYAIRTP